MTKMMEYDRPEKPFSTVRLIYMTPEEWISVPGNPRQRNTEAHAEYAKQRHLKEYDPVHATVIMAELPDGQRYKIDAHTRAFLWASGELQPPPILNVNVYRVRDKQGAMDLYDKIDNKAAVKGSRDEVYSTLVQDKIILESPYMRGCNVIQALKDAYSVTRGHQKTLTLSVTDLTNHWKDQLIAADGMKLNGKRFTSSLFAAVLVTLRKDPIKAYEFWTLYNEDKGSKADGRSDAIQALWERVGNFRKEGRLTASSNRFNVIYMGIRAYLGFKRNKTYGPSALNGTISPRVREWLHTN